ncbi:unannotated protein [freshwater metagenome]|uniref:Unannotated protein n=1 Tax=freshwater metagenome TaxID=449393 RepID=A0A6J7RGU3_9ZZZZ
MLASCTNGVHVELTHELTTYVVMSLPFARGAVHVRSTFLSPGVPATAVGRPGTIRGMLMSDSDDHAP